MAVETPIGDILRQLGLDEVISMFEEEKVTSSMVPHMSDEELKSLGINKIGDRYELRNQCQAPGKSSPSKDILGLISQIGKRKKKKALCSSQSMSSTSSTSCTSAEVGEPAQQITKHDVVVSVGWKQYNVRLHQYVHVYKMKGGGTHDLKIDHNCDHKEVLLRLKNLFFPNGKNGCRKIESMSFKLANYVGDPVSDELVLSDGKRVPFTIRNYVEYCKTKRIRLYLLTKYKSKKVKAPTASLQLESNESDSGDDFVDPGFASSSAGASIISLKRPHPDGPTPHIANDTTLPLPIASSTPSHGSTSNDLKEYNDLIIISSDSDGYEEPVLEEGSVIMVEPSRREVKKQLQDCKDRIRGMRAQHINLVDDGDCQHLRVRRHALVKDTFKCLKRPSFDHYLPLKVTFLGESGVDDGGLTRDFFTEVLRAIFNNPMLFDGDERSRSVRHNMQALDDGDYKLVGQLIAMALIHGGIPPNCMSKLQFQYLSQGFQGLQATSCDVTNIDVKDKIDVLMRAVNDSTLNMLLRSDPMLNLLMTCGIPVKPTFCLQDRDNIIKRICLHNAVLQVNAEILQLKEGLKLYGLLEMLVKYPKDGQLIMCYNDKFEMTSGDFLQQLKQPVFSPEGSNIKMREVDTLAYYTQFLEDLESSGVVCVDGKSVSMKDVLSFLTGAPCYPVTGWPTSPSVKFKHDCFERQIPLENQPCHCYPTASTCTFILTLPLHYKSYDSFQTAFAKAILYCKGFGQV